MNGPGQATLSEADLLALVSRSLPAAVQARYAALIERRQAEALTADEHQELLGLTEQVEQFDAQRVEYLAALARMRRVPISRLIADLGIDDLVQHG